jgi:hypothetical protein
MNNTEQALYPVLEVDPELRPGGATGRDGSPFLAAILAERLG